MTSQDRSAPERPDLYERLVALSREAFGAHDEYAAYPVMWPFVIARIEALPRGVRVLDLGAGITPLPLFLARNGARVETVDNHPTVRTLPFGEDWNGWGFFDYGAVHPNVVCHHRSVAEFEPEGRFDAIYSVGLIAHLPSAVRARLMANCARWLGEGGTLLLTIDLIPSTDLLWNRCAGREVEPPEQHGDVGALLNELKQHGFTVQQARTVRGVADLRTDLFLLHATRA